MSTIGCGCVPKISDAEGGVTEIVWDETDTRPETGEPKLRGRVGSYTPRQSGPASPTPASQARLAWTVIATSGAPVPTETTVNPIVRGEIQTAAGERFQAAHE